MKLLRTNLLIAALVLSASAICSAQPTRTSTANPSSISAAGSPQKDDDLLKLLEITKVQRDGAIEREKLKDAQLQAKDATIESKDGTITTLKRQLKIADEELAKRTQVTTGDEKMSKQSNDLIEDQRKRIQELEHPSLLSSIFDKRTLGGALAGTALGYGVCSFQSNGGSVSNLFNFSGVPTASKSFSFPSPPMAFYNNQQTEAERRLRQALKNQ